VLRNRAYFPFDVEPRKSEIAASVAKLAAYGRVYLLTPIALLKPTKAYRGPPCGSLVDSVTQVIAPGLIASAEWARGVICL